MKKWSDFAENKPNWNLEHYIDFFESKMSTAFEIRDNIKKGGKCY